jgi:ATP-dependent Lhr-like helicase
VEPVPVLPPELDGPVDPLVALVDVVRGRMAVRGPVTARQLADELALEESQVTAALESIEGSGTVLRGHFCAPLSEVHWCDRRLLARIQRLTLDGLRQKIKPVSRQDFVRYLLRRHRIAAPAQWTSPLGVREAVAMLQGFEAPAGSWEKHILAARVADYDPQWLDHLFLSGEVLWGRLRQPARDDRSSQSVAALTRMVPITLMLREHLPWLAEWGVDDSSLVETQNGSEGIGKAERGLRGNSRRVLELLSTRGALFAQELQRLADLLPGHLEEALRELAALGLATCDGFAAVRAFVAERRGKSRGRSAMGSGLALPAGRWSLFPGSMPNPATANDRIERWCELLLNRYGVVFRDLLAREGSAPSWSELAPVYRRLEMRGQVRGGRFVAQVSGEQFGLEAAVEQLREIRDTPCDGTWVLLAAADPLNLCGILDDHPRVPGNHRNALVVQDGEFVAAIQARQISFFVERDVEQAGEIRRALQTGRRRQELHVPEQWLGVHPLPTRPRSLSDAPSRTVRRP